MQLHMRGKLQSQGPTSGDVRSPTREKLHGNKREVSHDSQMMAMS